MARQTNIQDHCMAYGLSIPGNQLQLACSHSHDQRCKSCLEIKEVLEKVISVAESKEMVNKDAIMFKVKFNFFFKTICYAKLFMNKV